MTSQVLFWDAVWALLPYVMGAVILLLCFIVYLAAAAWSDDKRWQKVDKLLEGIHVLQRLHEHFRKESNRHPPPIVPLAPPPLFPSETESLKKKSPWRSAPEKVKPKNEEEL